MKGMNKIIRGWSFKSVLSYCEGRGSKNSPDGRLIGGNMAGQNVHELTNEFVHFRRKTQKLKRPLGTIRFDCRLEMSCMIISGMKLLLNT